MRKKKKVNFGLTNRRYIGKLCTKDHKYEDTEFSVRQKGSNSCVVCDWTNKQFAKSFKFFGQEVPTSHRGRNNSSHIEIGTGCKNRICLSCDEIFFSSFSGNRICNKCKTSKETKIEMKGLASITTYRVLIPK
jgi:hypothetical protein